MTDDYKGVVVGIGASAGGIPALLSMLATKPSLSCAFIVVSHLGDSRSHLVETLGSAVSYRVEWASYGRSLEPGVVFVSPPQQTVEFSEDGTLKLRPVEKPAMFPIDSFFRSLGERFGKRALAVVLSGGGSDGSSGVRTVKQKEGLVIVQEPDTCEFPDMPRNSIRTGIVDEILAPGQILEVIRGYDRNRHLGLPPADLEEGRLDSILQKLYRLTGHDFSCYKPATIGRRLERRMGLLSVNSLKAYEERLEEDQTEAQKLVHELRIGVTGFFRDPEVWEHLASEILGPLIDERDWRSVIRVWVTACSSGEEAYTVACILADLLDRKDRPLNFQVFATDIDGDALARGRDGLYTINLFSDVPERFHRFFEIEDSHFRARDILRDRILFSSHNLISDPPFSNLDLVCCRNFLIYLARSTQEKLMGILHYALQPDGALVLGASESISETGARFTNLSTKHRIYRKNKGVRGSLPALTSLGHEVRIDEIQRLSSRQQPTFDEMVTSTLIRAFVPATVLLNQDYRILYHQGDTDLFLTSPRGLPTNELFSLLRPGLAPTVRDVLDTVRDSKSEVRDRAARLKKDETLSRVQLSAFPVHSKQTEELLIALSVRREVSSELSAEVDIPEEHQRLVQQLSEELALTRRELEQALEQSSTTYDALRANNEEMLSMNEELQASNEELETHKEELQALNEELSTVNSELRDYVGRLEDANNDLSNFVSGSDVATLFLDSDLSIRQFTPAIEGIYGISESDLGRKLSVFSSPVKDPELFEEASAVLTDLQRREATVERDDGRWFLRRISPYRTQEGQVEGLVLTYSDITELVRAQKALAEQAQSLELTVEERTRELNSILENAPDVIARFDRELRHIFVNAKAEKITGLKKEDFIGKTNVELGWPEELNRLWAEKMHEVFESGEVVDAAFDFFDKSFLARIVPEFNDQGEVTTILCLTRDMTELREAQKTVERSERRLRATFQQAVVGFCHLSLDGELIRSNPKARALLEITSDTAQRVRLEERLHPDDVEVFKVGFQRVARGQLERFESELRCGIREGHRWLRLTFSLVSHNIEEQPYLFLVIEDIQSRRQAELETESLKEKLAQGQRLEQLGLMAGGVAHDFNNLLVGIVGSASLALENLPEGSPVYQDVEMVLEAGRRAGDLARQMLAYAGKATVEVVPVDPGQAIEEMIPLLNCLSRNGSKVEAEISEVDCCVRLDSTQFHEAMTNLVVNASECYGPEGGRILIRFDCVPTPEDEPESFQVFPESELSKKYARVRVSDQGPGMTQEVLDRIMDPFYSTKSDGRGLGVPMVVGFTKAHNGLLRVMSSPGLGTTFEILIPCLEGKASSPSASSEVRTISRQFSGDALVVDDEELVRVLMSRQLQRLGLQVTLALNGTQAIEIGSQRSFDLVILDLSMPDIGGAEVLQALRKHHPELPVVISSGYDREEVLDRLPRDENIAFLPKPYSIIQLYGVVENLIG